MTVFTQNLKLPSRGCDINFITAELLNSKSKKDQISKLPCSLPLLFFRADTLSLLTKDKDLQISLYLRFFGSICKIEHWDSENVLFIRLYPTLF